MKRNNIVIPVVCGLIAMIATIIFYLLAFDNIFTLPMRWVSLLFLLLIEVIGTVKSLTISKNIFGVASLITSVIHLGVVLIMSIVFVNVLPLLIDKYILLNLLILSIIAVIDVLLIHFSKKANEDNQKYTNASNVIDECYIKAKQLVMLYENSDYVAGINNIIELLQYSNRTDLCGNELDLLAKIEELESLISTDENERKQLLIEEVQRMLKLRSIQMKKRGSF